MNTPRTCFSERQTHAYDANGNMTTRGAQTLTWDVENRLTAVTGGAGMAYDGDGRRVKKTEAGETVHYPHRYYEKNSTTGVGTKYYYLGDRLNALRRGPDGPQTQLKCVRPLQWHMPRLKLPKPKAGVRPTSSKVRDAIYNMLQGEALEGSTVLDAYAGTGALGYEALERGAARVDFVDKDPEMCKRIREALGGAGWSEEGHVYCAPVKKAIGFLTGPYDLVFMDPPYNDPRISDTMSLVAGSGLLKRGGLLVVEHAWRVALPGRAGDLALDRTRRYGDSAVSIYRREQAI
jgi:16S rRNA (guanine(966)-N(2))-methyltransferase RsmD